MKRIFGLIFVVGSAFSQNALSAASTVVIRRAQDFFKWLDKNEASFLDCKIRKNGDLYILCDGTEVGRKDLADLFKKEAKGVIEDLKARGLKIEILCDPDPKAAKTFASSCETTSQRKMFREMSALHGQYLPEEKTILLRSSSLKGSLIHEYIHYLQSENKNAIYGKIYKAEKNQIRRELTAEMDRLIPLIETESKTGKKSQVAADLKTFMTVSETLRNFAPWQDLIDEREIFQLYLGFGSEFGTTADDLALAKRNMGFICKNPKWQNRLPDKECL